MTQIDKSIKYEKLKDEGKSKTMFHTLTKHIGKEIL